MPKTPEKIREFLAHAAPIHAQHFPITSTRTVLTIAQLRQTLAEVRRHLASIRRIVRQQEGVLPPWRVVDATFILCAAIPRSEMDPQLCDDGELRVAATRLGTAFFDRRVDTAWELAGARGRVATLPELLEARAMAPFDDPLWTLWYTADSAEYVGRTVQGTNVVVVAHGVGLFSTPERIRAAYTTDGVTIARSEFLDVLDKSMGYEAFVRHDAVPPPYGVILDVAIVPRTEHHAPPVPLERLREDPLFIARAGGMAAAHAYLDKVAARSSSYGHRHHSHQLGDGEPYGTILGAGCNDYAGLDSVPIPETRARFVALRREQL